MEISASTASYGQEALVASLAKRQQTQQGEASLALLQAATESAPVAAPSASGSLGNHIDIRV